MANDKVAIWNQTIKLGRSPANGELLIGNGTDFNLAALTAGSNVTITNSAGGITIASTNPGGTVTAVTASSPLASSGGNTPNISLSGTVAVGNGGTGATTLTANNVILGNGTSAVQFVAPGTSGNVLTSNGTTWTSAVPSGVSFVRMASDVAFTSTTTYGDLTGLSFTADASSNYVIEAFLYVTFAGLGKFKVTVPSPGGTPTNVRFSGIEIGFTAGGSTISGGAGGFASDIFSGYTVAYGNAMAHMFGFFTTDSSGTVKIQGSQYNSNGTATTFKAGSWLQYRKIS